MLAQKVNLAFSISATSRPPRGNEKHGVEYFFLSPDEFRQRIANNEFLEYEEVYTDRFYGTLKAQVEKQLAAGQNVVFDVDVVGGCNIKKYYGERALSLFIQPPCIDELRRRLIGRGTDTPEVIESRIAKAEYELSFAPKFDKIIINDDLETAKAHALKVIKEFLGYQGIRFETGGLQEALAKARKENKAVFVDCYTSWCGPCKMMSSKVFPDKQAGDFFNPRFISLKIDMEKDEGKELAQKWNIRVFPTYLILDPQGEIVYTSQGYIPAEELIRRMNEGLEQWKNNIKTGK